MPLLSRDGTVLLVVDLQARLMPAIEGSEAVLAAARLLLGAAALLGVPVLATEQNPHGLGPTLPVLGIAPDRVVAKTAFDATAAAGVLDRLPPDRVVLLAGCEAHVCVLQTALGLTAVGRRVAVALDATGSRRAGSHAAGLARMAAQGVEVVTAEMAVFEWLGSSDHPRFREALALLR
jgi:nicotinamidase-related amidase